LVEVFDELFELEALLLFELLLLDELFDTSELRLEDSGDSFMLLLEFASALFSSALFFSSSLILSSCSLAKDWSKFLNFMLFALVYNSLAFS
jgi:hypothetical protein